MDPLIALAIAALGIAALLTRVGAGLYATGLVRAKNSAATALRIISDLCISTLAFWAVGFAILSHAGNPWFGVYLPFLFGPTEGLNIPNAPLFLFYTVMVLTATYIVSGAVAERCRLLTLSLSSMILAGFVLPTTLKWGLAGWFQHNHGFVDIAGGATLHVTAGVFAIVALAFVGPRRGKYNRDGSSSMIPGHNLPMACVGVLVTVAGWIPYVAGANIVRTRNTDSAIYYSAGAAMNTLLAAAAAGTVSMTLSRLRYGKPDILLTMAAVLGGLVSICSGGTLLSPWAAVIIGAVTGVIVPLAVLVIDLRLKLDDPLGVIAAHLVGGAWGTLATGIFIAPISPMNRFQQIAIQVVGTLAMAAFAAVVAVVFFAILKSTIGLRAKEADEFDGLDLAEHDIGAYPDFQQNSIKSYHLRET